jgi:DNA-binding GntR family transcriptional regulator
MSREKRTVPRYLEIREALADAIQSGAFPVGGHIPTEPELCRRYSAGRHTIREAVRGLEEAGLVRRHAGVGTVVLARSTSNQYIHRLSSLESLWQYAAATRFEKEREGSIRLHGSLALLLGLRAGGRWLRLSGFRSLISSGERLCWSEIYVAAAYEGLRHAQRDETLPVYEQLYQTFGLEISEVEQRITAMRMPNKVAKALASDTGSPALVERRTYRDQQGRVFEVSLNIHPGERYANTTRLVREQLDRAAVRGAERL